MFGKSAAISAWAAEACTAPDAGGFDAPSATFRPVSITSASGASPSATVSRAPFSETKATYGAPPWASLQVVRLAGSPPGAVCAVPHWARAANAACHAGFPLAGS